VSSGRKDDQGKAPLWHLGYVSNALADVARVLDAGGKKYGVENWRKVGDFRNRYASALLRHVVAFLRGEVNDPDDGLPHLAHAVCCALFLMEGPAKEEAPKAWTPIPGESVLIKTGARAGCIGTILAVDPSGKSVSVDLGVGWRKVAFWISELSPYKVSGADPAT